MRMRFLESGKVAYGSSPAEDKNAGGRGDMSDLGEYESDRLQKHPRRGKHRPGILNRATQKIHEVLRQTRENLPLGPLILTILFLFIVTFWVMSQQYAFISADVVLTPGSPE